MRNYILITLLVLFFANSCQRDTVRMTDFEVQGIDISHHQSYLNWDTIKAQQIDFVFMKATEADDFVDTLFAYNWKEGTRVNIKKGAYHFFRPNISVEDQIDNFISTVTLLDGDLPPVLDIEQLDGVSSSLLVMRAKKWLKAIQNHYHTQPIVYTNASFYNKHLHGEFDDAILWVARYNTKEPLLRSNEWAFWQYGNRGKLDGVDGDLDFNVFKGSLEELDALCFRTTYSTNLIF